jgi:predicted ATP-dependent protease
MLRRISHDVLEQRKVPVEKLRVTTDPAVFPFEITDEIDCLQQGIIGQDRAVHAMEFGLKVKQKGYNLFLVGPVGTGKTTYAETFVRQVAKEREKPKDWCYVYNFKNPDAPKALSFPNGMGCVFKHRMDELLRDVEREIRKVFTSDDYDKQRGFILESYEKRAEEMWKVVSQFARELNFSLERAPQGNFALIPMQFGRRLTKEEFKALPDAVKEEYKERNKRIEDKMSETMRTMQMMEKEVEKAIKKLNQEFVERAINHLFIPLLELFKEDAKVVSYLKEYQQDVIENYHIFQEEAQAENQMLGFIMGGNQKEKYTRYQVNVFVDNSRQVGAPVIIESNPNYYNLFGKVEYKSSFGTMVTDFTMIKPGALHLANGGYLILQIVDILSNPYSWQVLKRTLKTGCIRIENVFEERGLVASKGLRPEAIPIDIKVLLIGTPYYYYLLSELDEDFLKLFKVKVEFDTEMDKNMEHHLNFASFVRSFCEKEGLLPFHRSALAALVDYSSRLVENQGKMSTRFNHLTCLMVEASFWASEEGAAAVTDVHVRRAIKEQEYRSNRVSEKIKELIVDGTIMVDVTGERVGQINGLAVLGFGDYSFGSPHRITAQTFVGRSGIINIERETSLSGQIHHKGLLILSGYLAGKFAQDKPLPLSASITFEQTYSMIDGDSASSTELYALLSSLSGIPIKQGIAVTGSVNQWGEIQPIGGVNDKIEGFYEVCKAVGLTGDQGVMIPHQNVKNLMLKDEVIQAVKQGLFHIWQVRNVEEGIEILTGVEAGTPDEDGNYPEGTVFYEINQRLEKMYLTIAEDKHHTFIELIETEDEKSSEEEQPEPADPKKPIDPVDSTGEGMI